MIGTLSFVSNLKAIRFLKRCPKWTTFEKIDYFQKSNIWARVVIMVNIGQPLSKQMCFFVAKMTLANMDDFSIQELITVKLLSNYCLLSKLLSLVQ